MKGNPVAQETSRSEQLVPRNGSIYDRLDKAREQRMKSLSPQVAANDASGMRPRTRHSKSHLFPTIKTQDAFEPVAKTRISRITKLGIGLLAVSVLAGFTLLGWGSGPVRPLVTDPAELAPTQVQMALPEASPREQGAPKP